MVPRPNVAPISYERVPDPEESEFASGSGVASAGQVSYIVPTSSGLASALNSADKPVPTTLFSSPAIATFATIVASTSTIDATVAWCINSAIAEGIDIAVAAITSDLTTGVAATIATKEPRTSHPNPFTSPQCGVGSRRCRNITPTASNACTGRSRSGAGSSRDPFICLTVAASGHYADLRASSWHVAEPSPSGRREGEPTGSGTSDEILG
ncbi:Proline-rich receptor-like protein kinase PERK12 [Hordeum vulgare]|nr:Proline-rich receptor-like protein kinase PERK12 [Hordeum vulgare]